MTLKQLADIVGVSTTAVSVVLAGKPNHISSSMKEKIFAAAKLYHYVPSKAASYLRTKRSKTIGLILPNVANGFYSEYTDRLQQYIVNAGYNLFIYTSNGDCEREVSAYNCLNAENIDGLFIIPSSFTNSAALINRLTNEKLPIVALDGYIQGLLRPMIATDYYEGAYRATEFLIKNGHKKISCIIGNADSYSVCQKLSGFYDAMSEKNCEFDFSGIYSGCLDAESGYAAADTILHSDTSAVFCFSDMTAYGLMRRVREQGGIVGKDLSVIGFDDLPASAYFDVPLTSVRHDTALLAETSVLKLIAMIEGGDITCSSKLIAPSLIVRESVFKI